MQVATGRAEPDQASMQTGSVSPRHPRGATTISAIIGIAIYLLLFSNLETVALQVQLSAIGFLALAAGIALYQGIRPARPTLFEVTVVAASVFSLIAVLLRSDGNNAETNMLVPLSSALFAVVIISSSVIVRAVKVNSILKAAAVAYCFMVLTILIFHTDDILSALAPDAAERWALRTRAFNLHPNLEGYIFGGGVILCARQAFISRGLMSAVHAICAVTCAAIVLAASARGGLLALTLSLAIVSVPLLPKLNVYQKLLLFTLTIFALGALVLNSKSVGDYLWDVLELGSKTRGLDTGGTGRTELWSQGIDLMFSSMGQLLIGGGIRSSVPENIGFSTENSYITIILDSGLIFGGAIIFSILLVVVRSFWWVRWRLRKPVPYALISALLVFAVLQAFVNRYLLAIGNPLSLLCILLLCWQPKPDPDARREA